MTELWLNKQSAPQEQAVKKSIAAVRSCGAFVFNTFPAEQAGGQNNKSLRGIPLVSPGFHNTVERNEQVMSY